MQLRFESYFREWWHFCQKKESLINTDWILSFRKTWEYLRFSHSFKVPMKQQGEYHLLPQISLFCVKTEAPKPVQTGNESVLLDTKHAVFPLQLDPGIKYLIHVIWTVYNLSFHFKTISESPLVAVMCSCTSQQPSVDNARAAIANAKEASFIQSSSMNMNVTATSTNKQIRSPPTEKLQN